MGKATATKLKGTRARYDWQAIRLEYTTSPTGTAEITLEGLARKWGCGKRQLFARSSAERWPERRAEYRRKAAEIAQGKAAESEGERLHRHAQLAKLIQVRGAEAISKKKIVPDAGKVLAAIKLERALYGEAGEVAKAGITDRDRRIAAAYWRAHAEIMREEQEEENRIEQEKAKRKTENAG